MRTFFWDPLPAARVAGTFWEERQPDYSLLGPTAEVEELFGAAIRRPGASGASPGAAAGGAGGAGTPGGRGGAPGGAAKGRQAVQALDTRRATNIGGFAAAGGGRGGLAAG